MELYELKFKEYNRSNKERSRSLRSHTTLAETKVWKSILKKKQTGYIFVRQKPMWSFILDFYCSELLLAIEIDGSSHNDKQDYDNQRDERMRHHGIKTVRITNHDVFTNLSWVYDWIQEEVKKRVQELKIT